jgi:LmbE family N-acetylglucosaminyl deacetylase
VTKAYNPPWSEETISAASKQVDEVAKLFGFSKTYKCDFPTVMLNTVPYREISSKLQEVVNNSKPEVVYTTSASDLNQDHRIVHECTLVATRPLPNTTVRKVLSYEISTTSKYGYGVFCPTIFVDISKYLAKKIEVMKLYDTEIKEWPHPRSIEGIRIIAKERGLAIGVAYAECFELVREIIK